MTIRIVYSETLVRKVLIFSSLSGRLLTFRSWERESSGDDSVSASLSSPLCKTRIEPVAELNQSMSNG